jgi:predicted porin
MKKQLLKTAVVAAIVLPMAAQAGVYGRADGVVRYVDDGANSTWDVGADKMRWGIVGSEDLGNGMKALYHYEFALDTDDQGNVSTQTMEKTRLAHAGLQGSWGTVRIGRQWWPSYFAVWGTNDMGDAHALFGGQAASVASGGLNQANPSNNRNGNMISYKTPDFSGFTVDAAIVMDDNDSDFQDEDGVDVYDLSATYKNGPLKIAGTFRNSQIAGWDTDMFGIAGKYSFGDFSVEGSYGNVEGDDTTPGSTASHDTDVWTIGGMYKMGNTHIWATYRDTDNDSITTEWESDWALGVRHFMSKETRVFAEYRDREQETAGGGENQMFAIGLRKDWKL